MAVENLTKAVTYLPALLDAISEPFASARPYAMPADLWASGLETERL